MPCTAVVRDPVEFLGEDIADIVFSFLDPWSLRRCSFVSRAWRRLALCDKRWQRLCSDLWADKKYVPLAIKNRLPAASAYWASLRDAERDVVSREELCSFTWAFRFKHQDLPWMLSHPFWRFMPLLYRRFHEDGSISAAADDPIFGRHETIWRFAIAGSTDGSEEASSSSNGGERNQGRRVRVTHWPALTLSRRPDWGWLMQNHYVVYTSLHGEDCAQLKVDVKPQL